MYLSESQTHSYLIGCTCDMAPGQPSETNTATLCSCPHSASWPRLAQTQSACSICAGTTTRSRPPPSFTVSWSSRSSKPSRSPRASPTATSSPPPDQDSTSSRHQKNRQNILLATDLLFKNYSTFFCLFFDVPVIHLFVFSGEREGIEKNGLETLKKKGLLYSRWKHAVFIWFKWSEEECFNNYIYRADFKVNNL